MMLDMLMMRIELRTGLAISIYHGRADGEGLMKLSRILPFATLGPGMSI